MTEACNVVSLAASAPVDIVARLATKLDSALDDLEKAKPFAKISYQTAVFQLAETLMGSHAGLRQLYARAPRFDEAGVFAGGPWVDSTKLRAPLVAGGLKAGGVYPVVETLSELRMLAIAKGKIGTPEARQGALVFLKEVMALNLAFIFPADTEDERRGGGTHHDSHLRLFALMTEELPLGSLRGDVLDEIEQIIAQRPIMTRRLRTMIEMAGRIPPDPACPDDNARLKRFAQAVETPTPLSQQYPALATYRDQLKDATFEMLKVEALAFGESLESTGLASLHHAILLRHLRSRAPELIGPSLALNDLGEAELAQNREFALQIIRVGIVPATAQSIYGFAKVLQLGLLSPPTVKAGILRLIDLDLQAGVKRDLLTPRRTRDGVTANSLLVSGVLSVFGQPLGVGQGNNPTCQTARAISLWSQHAQGYLLEILISAARDGFVQAEFEGEILRSDRIQGGLIGGGGLDLDLDPVSIVLTPHLDRLYDAMMTRVALRQEDGHKWVNPSLYGRWVPRGFASVFADRAQTTVADYDEFLRRFYATHHPAYNDGHTLMYPNPVGIIVTNSDGVYLGPHAVSLQRIAEGNKGVLRAFFYNPNNEGRQNWGNGIEPMTTGNGEAEGESSLPFHEFAARLYAFHYNPYEEGDAYAVPLAAIEEIETAARESWGRVFSWT